MRVELEVKPLPDFPPLEGAHELSWSYLLDHIYADAYAANLETLTFILPSSVLSEEVQLRSLLTSAQRGARGRGVALLGDTLGARACERLYHLEFGVLAPLRLRAAACARPKEPWQPEHRLSVLSLEARLWGLPIRLAQLFRRPDFHDRALFKMRQRFAKARTPAYYHLTTYHLTTYHLPRLSAEPGTPEAAC